MTRNRLNKEDITETNPYQMVILNRVYKDDIKTEQMIHWSLISDLIKYTDGRLDMSPCLTVKPLDYRQHKRFHHSLKTDKSLTLDIEFEGDKLKEEYFEKYDGLYTEILQVTRFDERTDLSTTYLGRIDITRDRIIKLEEKFPISEQGYTNGKLLDNSECSILIDTGASKSYMSKSYYMQCKSLHALPKFASTMQRVQVGNGQCVAVLFVIPVVIAVYGHRCEAFTLVSEIHGNVDLVLIMKNVFTLEGVIDMPDSSFKYLNRSIPFLLKEQMILKPKERKVIKIEAPFIDEVSGLAIVKMLYSREQYTVVLKLKSIRN